MSDVFTAGRRAKVERKRTLAEALSRAPEPDPAAERELDALADAVLTRIASRTTQEVEPEPESERRVGGFDGGARQPVPPPPEDHGAWLVRVIRERRADVGARFGG
jgi:hypothetical protein